MENNDNNKGSSACSGGWRAVAQENSRQPYDLPPQLITVKATPFFI